MQKIASDQIKQTRKTLSQVFAVGVNFIEIEEQKVEGFLSTEAVYWWVCWEAGQLD